MFRKKKLQSYQDLFAQKRKNPVFAVPAPGKRLRPGPGRRWEKGWIQKYLPPIPKRFPPLGLGQLKLLWLGLPLAVLVVAFLNREAAGQEAAYIYGMLALSFPTGLLVPALFSLIIKHVYYIPAGFSFDLLLWPFFIAAGYAQWFLLPRWLLAKFRKQRA